MFEQFDGSGREPRDVQKQALKFVQDNLGTRFIALECKTGSGKSAIARAIQMHLGGYVIVPTNQLMDQYIRDYPKVNYVKGATHYTCEEDETISCEDRKRACKSVCKDCPWQAARTAAGEGQDSFLNPISKMYLQKEDYNVMIIDEAHKLEEMLEMLTTMQLKNTEYDLPDSADFKVLIPWLEREGEKYKEAGQMYRDKNMHSKSSKAFSKSKRLKDLAYNLDKFPDLYAVSDNKIYDSKVRLNVRAIEINPVILPQVYLERMFGEAKNVIFLSATLPKFKVLSLTRGAPFQYVSMQNPIPPERRLVELDYNNFSYKTSEAEIRDWIMKQYENNGKPATIVHVTYALGAKLKAIMPKALYHKTVAEKDSTLEYFKTHGGIWLAAGCAEGIDLKHDYARLNLIPVIPYANAKDPVVEARVKRFGFGWYERMTLLTVIQMVGRTTRAPDDFSKTVIGDARIAKLFAKYRSELPECFLKSIVW